MAVILLYTIIYPRVSRLVVNNMCMLMAIGFIMITRLSYSLAVKQFLIVSASVAISLVIPVIIRKDKSSVRMENILCNCRMFVSLESLSL